MDRLNAVKERYHVRTSYSTQGKGEKGLFSLTFRVPASRKRVMMVALIEAVAGRCVVQVCVCVCVCMYKY